MSNHPVPESQPAPFNAFTTGVAMFAMFFGAGNVVFPLALGQYAKDHTIYAFLGLLITAVGVPFLGLIAMTLFNGNYNHFFERIGKVPGFLVAAIIMGLIGPFGATPRCIALSYSTFSMFIPDLSVPLFSFISCVLIFLFTFKKNKILDVLGYILTPFLLFSLFIIIALAFYLGSPAPASEFTAGTAFFEGFKEGYQMMDLVAAFFFSSVVISCLEQEKVPHEQKNYKQMVFLTLKASIVGASLLAICYFGFCFAASYYSRELASVSKDQLLGALAMNVLGPNAALVALVAVALACLTTAIALAAVFAEFIQNDLTKGKIGYIPALIITLIITYFISTLKFHGIAAFLVPILQVSYPALIILSILNIAYKLHHFKPVKVPVLVVFLLSLISYVIEHKEFLSTIFN